MSPRARRPARRGAWSCRACGGPRRRPGNGPARGSCRADSRRMRRLARRSPRSGCCQREQREQERAALRSGPDRLALSPALAAPDRPARPEPARSDPPGPWTAPIGWLERRPGRRPRPQGRRPWPPKPTNVSCFRSFDVGQLVRRELRSARSTRVCRDWFILPNPPALGCRLTSNIAWLVLGAIGAKIGPYFKQRKSSSAMMEDSVKSFSPVCSQLSFYLARSTGIIVGGMWMKSWNRSHGSAVVCSDTSRRKLSWLSML
jgi:hypothetical protein